MQHRANTELALILCDVTTKVLVKCCIESLYIVLPVNIDVNSQDILENIIYFLFLVEGGRYDVNTEHNENWASKQNLLLSIKQEVCGDEGHFHFWDKENLQMLYN